MESFIYSLEEMTVARVLKSMDLLQKFGFKLGMPHVKKIHHGLFELRVRGKQEIRIFFRFHQGRIELIHGFIKKTNQTPRKEIKLTLKKLENI